MMPEAAERRFLRRRLATLAGLLILPLLLLATVSYLRLLRVSTEAAREETRQLAGLMTARMRQGIEEGRQILFCLSQIPEVRAKNASYCTPLFQRLAFEMPRFLNFGLIGADGEVLASALPFPSPMNLGDRGYFSEAMATGRFTVGEYQIGRITGKPSLNVAYPVSAGDGPPSGVLFGAISLSWLDSLAAESRLQPGTTLLFVDRAGLILARHPDAAKFVGKRYDKTELVLEILEQEKTGAAEAAGLDGVRRFYTFERLQDDFADGEIFTCVGIPLDAIYGPSRKALVFNLLLVAGATLAGLGAAWFLAARPLEARATRQARAAATDPLTGIANRRALFEVASSALRAAGRDGRPLSAILFDLDHFKRINDTRGHAAGDEVLREVARRAQQVLRDRDILGRYGGEEFAAILPGADAALAAVIAERLRQRIASEPIDGIPVSASLGVAQADPGSPGLEDLLLRADAALYEAKRAGRNCVKTDGSIVEKRHGDHLGGA